MRLGFSSPIVIISGCLPFERFLELTVTENAFYHELLTEITRRTLRLIDAVFAHSDIDTTVNFGGSEQCTPPMMSPHAFDEFVVPYDGQLVRRLKEHGVLVHYHVHGKIRHALKCLVDMSVDSTDPVEPPPAGDVTYAEAREIVGDDLTLVGNLEWDELAYGEPEQTRQRVREILALGNRRLILGSSAGPISRITPRIAANYRAWVEAALRYG
jgi:uroporphyrinogen-III decarboxylase